MSVNFATNWRRIEREIQCDNDCLQSGCPGHLLELHINNTACVAELTKDKKHIMWLDSNEAAAIQSMFNQIENE